MKKVAISRASEVAGPVSSDLVRAQARQLASLCGWSLTVDALASESNSLLPRFFARFAEPRAEAEYAFTVPSWAYSTCPACGALHRETLFAFPLLPSSTRSWQRHAPTALARLWLHCSRSLPRFGTSCSGPPSFPTEPATSAFGERP